MNYSMMRRYQLLVWICIGFNSPNWQLDAVFEKYNIEKRKENRPVKNENSDS